MRLALALSLLLPLSALAEDDAAQGWPANPDDPDEPDAEGGEGDEGSEEGGEAEVAPTPTPPPPAEDPRVDKLLKENAVLLQQLQSLGDQVKQLDLQLNPPPPPIVLPKLELRFGGYVQGEARFRVADVSTGEWYDPYDLSPGITRLENINKFRLEAKIAKFRAFTDIDFVISGHNPIVPNQPNFAFDLGGLSNYSALVNVRLEPHSAYVEARDLVPGLSIRIGQQLVQWGVGDQFNPTNTLNAWDLEDPVLFGTQQGNLMAKVDYDLLGKVQFSGVLIPIFRPALTPNTGVAALANTAVLPYVDDDLRYRVHASNALAVQTGTPVIVDPITVEQPPITPENMMFAFRVGTNVGGQDLAISYNYGRVDIPQSTVVSNTIDNTDACNGDPQAPDRRPLDGNNDPIIGLNEECYTGFVKSENTLSYPRQHVLGFNAAGEIPGLQLGYRFELGVFFPEAHTGRIYKPFVSIDPTPQGEFDYDNDGVAGGPAPLVNRPTPFPKWSLGFDRALGPHFILNVMWVHGFPDEYGAGSWVTDRDGNHGEAVRQGGLDPGLQSILNTPGNGIFTEDDGFPSLFDCATTDAATARQCVYEITRPRIGDFIILGLDFNFARNKGLIRLFTIWEANGYKTVAWDQDAGEQVTTYHHMFSADGFSAELFPEVRWAFGNGFELSGAALIPLGKPHTKFGDPAVGGPQVLFRAKYSY